MPASALHAAQVDGKLRVVGLLDLVLGERLEDDFDALAETRLERIEESDLVGNVAFGRAALLALLLRGVLADDEDLLERLRVERKDALLVLSEDDRLFADQTRDLLVLLRVALACLARRASEEARLRHHEEDVKRHLVDSRLGNLPGLDRLDDRKLLGLGIVVELDLVAAVHLDAAAVVGGELVGVLPAPVGLDEALEAPAVAQDAGLQVLVLGSPDSVDLVVGRHHAKDARILHRRAERGEVDFVERPQVAVGVDVVAVPLLVVEAVVLDGCSDVVALDTLDHRHAHLRREAGIFAEVFPVAAVEGRAGDVDAGPEQFVNATIAHLGAKHLAVESRELDVPGGGERGERRELGVLASRLRVTPVPAVHLRADGRRVVAHRPLLRDSHARNRGESHRARPACEERFLLERHLGKRLAGGLESGLVVEHCETGNCGRRRGHKRGKP